MTNRRKYSKKLEVILVFIGISIIGLGYSHLNACNTTYAACHLEQQVENMSQVKLAPGYVVYSDQELAQALRSNMKVVLYFWAPWCSSCTSVDLDLQQGKQIVPDNTVILRLEYNKYPELERKYNIVTQHTFVQVDSEKKELAKWVGGGVETFLTYLK